MIQINKVKKLILKLDFERREKNKRQKNKRSSIKLPNNTDKTKGFRENARTS